MMDFSLLLFNMEKEFVTYEQALSLKDLGFNEGCFAYWWKERQEFPFVSTKKEIIQIVDYEFFYNLSKGGSKGLVSAPTFSQAFRWFDKFNAKT